MSGIYGAWYRQADREKVLEAAGGLSYWNSSYGREAFDEFLGDRYGVGCHIEHFSETFPHGGPVLDHGGCPAVVDALLYNRDELLPMLGLGADASVSDEELLLMLIRQKGFDALEAVNGDFAGAIYDREKQTWTLFRDHMGVRPLYYYADPDTFAFSTDIRGVVAAPGVDSRFNEMMFFKSVIRASTLSVTDTDFQHIHCVRPGSVTRFVVQDDRIGVEEKVYWRVRRKKLRLKNDEAYRAELRRLVTDAVNRRCDAFPGLLGGELSGGLDSCIIDILVNRHGRKGVYYSWSLSLNRRPLQEGEDERKVILDVCDQENITCRFMERADQFDFKYMLTQYMPPFVNAPHMAFGSRWMRAQGARAVFSGYGGDEGVSHRCRPFELLYNGEWFSYFKIYWKYLEGRKFRLTKAIYSGIREARDRYKRLRPSYTREDLLAPLLKRDFNERMIEQFEYQPLTFSYAPHIYVDQGGTRSRLDNAAYMGAFCGVRYLFPYVDHRVMDFALSIPRRLHVNHKTSRLIFRETFHDIMPESLRNMFYKDMASTRTTDRAGYANVAFHHNVDWLLETLDRDIWGDAIDFESMRALHKENILEEKDMGIYTLLMHKLNKCVAIQNIQKNAKRWREFRAENKIL